MIRRPTRSTRTDTLFPYTTLFRSTTLFNCITGEVVPTSGSIVFDGKVISGLPPHKLPGLGIARSFQRTSIFPHMTVRSEEHTSELQSLMRISYAVFCLKKKNDVTNDD